MVGKSTKTPYERLMAKTERVGDCLIVPSARGWYSHIGDYDRKLLGHRVVWEHHNGPIPKGIDVCHTCDNPPCIEIDHLFMGTRKDNVRDMFSKGRSAGQRKTHCIHGHEYTPENTYWSHEHRFCIECRRAQDRRRGGRAGRRLKERERALSKGDV